MSIFIKRKEYCEAGWISLLKREQSREGKPGSDLAMEYSTKV